MLESTLTIRNSNFNTIFPAYQLEYYLENQNQKKLANSAVAYELTVKLRGEPLAIRRGAAPPAGMTDWLMSRIIEEGGGIISRLTTARVCRKTGGSSQLGKRPRNKHIHLHSARWAKPAPHPPVVATPSTARPTQGTCSP